MDVRKSVVCLLTSNSKCARTSCLTSELPELNYMTLEEENFAKNFARFINEANVIEINELFQRASPIDIGQNANAKIVFYDMALKLIVLLLKK